MDVLTKIDGSYPSLTKSEQKIAQYVLINADEIEHLSIGLLASKAEVAETTVIRFCRKLDFDGYQDFKLKLARDLAVSQVRHAKGGDAGNEIVSGYIDYLQRLGASVSTKKLTQVAKKINSAHAVCIFSAGISSLVAAYLKTRLMRMGINVIFDPDVHLQAIDIAVLQRDDLVITISQTGNTNDVIRNVEIAKKAGVKIVGITNYLGSQLASLADIMVNPPTGNGNDSAELTPVMGQLVVIEQICYELKKINPERTQMLKDKINKTLINRI